MKYNLQSTPLIFTPGVVAYVGRVYMQDPEAAREILRVAFAELPETSIDKLLAGDYTVEDETVIVTDD